MGGRAGVPRPLQFRAELDQGSNSTRYLGAVLKGCSLRQSGLGHRLEGRGTAWGHVWEAQAAQGDHPVPVWRLAPGSGLGLRRGLRAARPGARDQGDGETGLQMTALTVSSLGFESPSCCPHLL